MAETTEISWADATFNPWWGCTKVSDACDHCYAETFSRRVGYSETGSQFPIWGKDAQRRFFGDSRWNEPLKWDRRAANLGIRVRVFCGSMCDVMEDRQDLHEHRLRLYDLIEATPNLDWLLLTKRPQNFRRFLPESWLKSPRRNVWGMTTVESNEYRWRINMLADTPLAVRGLSCEPLLGPLDLSRWLRGIHWVIVGGESGHHARPMHAGWAQSIRDQCQAAGVAFHFKQHGEWLSLCDYDPFVHGFNPEKYAHEFTWPSGEKNDRELPTSCYRVGKKAAGRLLDGRTWDEVPM